MGRYITAAELRAFRDIQGHVVIDDTRETDLISAAEDAIDEYCGRTFAATGSSVARIFPAGGRRVPIDDAQTVTAVTESSDRVTWDTVATSDWYTGPDNASALEWLENASTSGTFAPWVTVTGTYGWDAVPSQVKEATLLYAARLASRAKSPSGIETIGADFGVFRVSQFIDSDVRLLLSTLRRVDLVLGIA